ncbi:hypothetical protein DSL72_001687 [Monilinia vaccinii-corymbosi]|uniref:Uncharacterized protein n=1 Tax=Monilinia vaccinii-corymbosi TaxID=61207 RepID=A0A8A3P9I2_9HELO|nr:hypothetical protein DSL72_001687 [Monilinia vaccinii-corymbosi]
MMTPQAITGLAFTAVLILTIAAVWFQSHSKKKLERELAAMRELVAMREEQREELDQELDEEELNEEEQRGALEEGENEKLREKLRDEEYP